MTEEIQRHPTVVQANESLTDEDYPTAIELYTKAIDELGESSYLLTKRAAAYFRNDEADDSLEDSTRAIELDDSNAMAHYRKAEALLQLQEPESARLSLEAALAPSRVGLGKGTKTQAEKKLQSLKHGQNTSGSSASKSKGLAPSKNASTYVSASTQSSSQKTNSIRTHGHLEESTSGKTFMTATGPIRKTYDWHQTDSHVTITMFAKRAIKEKSEIDVKKKILSVCLAQETGSEFHQDVLLYDEVDPQDYTVEFKEKSVDITMKKAKEKEWPCLNPYDERERRTLQEALGDNPTANSAPSKPVYPTSVPKKKDWSALEKMIEEEEEEEAKNETDSNKGLQHLFQTIYKDADEDTRRAMIKSFTESGGKALSTNWSEVKDKDYSKQIENEDFSKKH